MNQMNLIQVTRGAVASEHFCNRCSLALRLSRFVPNPWSLP
jgi:hypothetical protein